MKLLMQGDAKRADAYMPVSWCIDQQTRDRILEKKISDPQVLLVTATSKPDLYQKDELVWEEESRNLIPLNYQTVYVAFNKAGEHRIFATILGEEEVSTTKLYKEVMKKSNRYIGRMGEFDPPSPHLNRAQMDVYVPSEFFAPEPPEWEKKFFSLIWRKDKTVDQCDWRKRRILAYSLGWMFLILWYIIRFVIGFVTYSAYFVGGSRGLYFRPVWNHNFEVKDIYETNGATFGNSIFLTDSEGNPRMWTRAAHPVFLGISLFAFLMVLLLLGYNYDLLWRAIKETWWALLLFFAVGGVVAYLMGRVLDYFDRLVTKLDANKYERQAKKRVRKEASEAEKLRKRLERQSKELDLISCDKNAIGATHSTYQSVVLSFQSVKSRICRPFQKA